jgi:hypothetical protein
MSKQNKLLNNLIFVSSALLVPYAYYFIIRPRLLQAEKRLDDRMTDIKDKDFQEMKRKMKELKGDSNDES